MAVQEENSAAGDKKMAQKVCLKPRKNDSSAAQKKAAEETRHILADQAKFMKMVMGQRLATKTVIMRRGQPQQHVDFDLPWIIKPLKRGMNWVVDTKAEAKKLIDMYTLKGSGCQVQRYLRGFRFAKVSIRGGRIEGKFPKHVLGKVQKIATVIVMMGAQNFDLTVAYNSDTSYIIGAKPV